MSISISTTPVNLDSAVRPNSFSMDFVSSVKSANERSVKPRQTAFRYGADLPVASGDSIACEHRKQSSIPESLSMTASTRVSRKLWLLPTSITTSVLSISPTKLHLMSELTKAWIVGKREND